MADYEDVVRGKMSLKLKGVSEAGIKRRKKRKKVDASKMAAMQMQQQQQQQPPPPPHQQELSSPIDDSPEEKKVNIQKTKAQLAFEKMQEKRQMQKILEKASKTHKQRVEEFNRHLDSLTEHYDIPKVSWTK